MSSQDKYITELKESPLFALSKCSNELAHTNFWVWLIEEFVVDNKHIFIEAFVPDFYKKKYVFDGAEREIGHRDLTLYCHAEGEDEKTKCYIVENKIKAIPEAEQLQTYQKEVGSAFIEGILTGINDTLDSKPYGWSFISHREIAERMEQILNTKKVDADKKKVIEQYIQDIRNISNIINTGINNAGDMYEWEVEKEVDDIKLGDILLKQLGCNFAKEIRAKIEEEKNSLRSSWGLPFVRTDFNNKKATITIVYKESDKRGEEPSEEDEFGRLGVQIEGKQFRIYGGRGPRGEEKLKAADTLYKEFEKRTWFESYNKKAGIAGHKTGMREKSGGKSYCKYTGKDYTHIYQWWEIKKRTAREDLCNDIISQLNQAKEMIDGGYSFK